jgi:hypothetical protein
MDNPLGVVPIVQLRNSDLLAVGWFEYPEQLLDYGTSEIHDLIPLVDGVNKLLSDMLVTAEFNARPRRWATGIEQVERPKLDAAGQPVLDTDGAPVMETVNPIPEGDRMMIGEEADIKFGQLDAASLAGYENGVGVLMQQIAAVSALPHYLLGGQTDNPASADALRASEQSLTARAEARQRMFGKAWEQVARLIIAIRDSVDPASVTVQVQWAPADTRSISAEADATLKLVQAKVLSRTGALRQLGWSEDAIADELKNIASEALASADPAQMSYFTSQITAPNLTEQE